ncbi:MAG: hypothetical protein QXW69_04615 [Nitrososphaerota archaeon]
MNKTTPVTRSIPITKMGMTEFIGKIIKATIAIVKQNAQKYSKNQIVLFLTLYNTIFI